MIAVVCEQIDVRFIAILSNDIFSELDQICYVGAVLKGFILKGGSNDPIKIFT
jgi:hypothetical protein